MKIRWEKYFDKIFCVHYVPFEDRFYQLCKELKYMDILDSPIFEWKKVYNNDVVLDIIEKSTFNKKKKNKKVISNTLAQFDCWNQAAYHNYKRTLIIEDDIVFRKNKEIIYETLENLPNDFDICLFDYIFPKNTQVFQTNKDLDIQVSKYLNTKYYGIYNIGWLNTCYCISNKFAKYIIGAFGTLYDSSILPADWYTHPNEHKELKLYINNYENEEFKTIYSNYQFGIQTPYQNSNNVIEHKSYFMYNEPWVDWPKNLKLEEFKKI